ncbi:hypothetical protein KVV02_000830 [Mortierella alpina]|uniref:Uncharacterized protein n=1 Tax=Mortierella alpina TaxID=64518 RepID=A0A9P8A3P3_MORAP|nr:hypothetical protein KVV02_000830 [Mortierella alpina]
MNSITEYHAELYTEQRQPTPEQNTLADAPGTTPSDPPLLNIDEIVEHGERSLEEHKELDLIRGDGHMESDSTVATDHCHSVSQDGPEASSFVYEDAHPFAMLHLEESFTQPVLEDEFVLEDEPVLEDELEMLIVSRVSTGNTANNNIIYFTGPATAPGTGIDGSVPTIRIDFEHYVFVIMPVPSLDPSYKRIQMPERGPHLDEDSISECHAEDIERALRTTTVELLGSAPAMGRDERVPLAREMLRLAGHPVREATPSFIQSMSTRMMSRDGDSDHGSPAPRIRVGYTRGSEGFDSPRANAELLAEIVLLPQDSPVDPALFLAVGCLELYDQDQRHCVQSLREERKRLMERRQAIEIELMRQDTAEIELRAEDKRIHSLELATVTDQALG